MPDVPMPRLSDSMEEGTVVRWLKADGDRVRRGEEIAEIETDKATMAYEADADGVLSHLVAEGETVAVGAAIARIGDAAGPGPVPAEQAAAAPRSANGAGRSPAAGDGAGAAPAARDGLSASPVARRLATSLGVDLHQVPGSGPHGRILKTDVRAAAAATAPAAASDAPVLAPPPSAPAIAPEPATPSEPAVAAAASDGSGAAIGARGAAERHPLTRLQQTVARRMAESRATVPDFSVSADVDMRAVLDLRERLAARTDPAPSINDVLIKLVAVALRRHPRVNGAYRDGVLETFERVNVGFAVAAEDALVVPTVFDADRLGLAQIATATRRLAQRVRDGAITPPELAGGTFTVSNLGMFGVDRFAGIINPPQAAILCVGAAKRRPVALEDDTVVVRPVATLTLVCDHRILYGADASRFLATVRELAEDPVLALG